MELQTAKKEFIKDLRNFLLILGLFAVGAALQAWMKPDANHWISMTALLLWPFGACVAYTGIKAALSWREVKDLRKQLQSFAELRSVLLDN